MLNAGSREKQTERGLPLGTQGPYQNTRQRTLKAIGCGEKNRDTPNLYKIFTGSFNDFKVVDH